MNGAVAATGLLFSFAELSREIENMRLLARPFLSRESFESVIPAWRTELETFSRKFSEMTWSWEIPRETPITTKVSNGTYEASGKGKPVVGELSAVWQIRLEWETNQGKKKPCRNFCLAGKASTLMRVLSVPTDDGVRSKELARWRMEIASLDTPAGCFFHSQILGDDQDEVFPKELSVPRLPGLHVSPIDGLDFLLGELFQQKWTRHASKSSPALSHLSQIQQKRTQNLLRWKLRQLANATSTPWVCLKDAKPDRAMFVGSTAK